MSDTNTSVSMAEVMDLLKKFGEFAFGSNFNVQFSLSERNDWVAKFVNADGKILNFDNKIMEFRAKHADGAMTGLAKQFLEIINQENEAKQDLLQRGKKLNLVV